MLRFHIKDLHTFRPVAKQFLLRNIEIFLFIGFIVASLFIDTYKLYLLLVCGYFGLTLLLIENVATATWVTFVSLLLFFKTKNFTFYFGNPEYYFGLIGEMPNITFFVSFADALLLILLYIVFVRDRAVFARPVSLKQVDWILIGLLLIGSIASMTSFFPAVSWFWFFQFLKYIVIFYLAKILVITDSSIIRKTVHLFLLFTLFNAALVILQKIHGGPLGLVVENMFAVYGKYADESVSLYRPGGVYWDPNLTATFFSVSMPFWLFFSLTKTSYFRKTMSLLALFLVVIALFFTASRAAWISSFMIISTVLYVLKQRGLLVYSEVMKKYLVLLGFLTVLIVSPLLINRVLSIGETLDERGGLFYRVSHISLATDLMLTSPVGVGMNMFQYEILRRYDPYRYFHDSTPAHNLFAEVGSSMGVLGLSLFILLVVIVGKHLLQQVIKKLTQHGLQSHVYVYASGFAILAYFICSQFYPWLFSSVITSVVWIFLGFSYASATQKASKKN